MAEDALYPPIEPYERGELAVDELHTLYWEVSGNPNGKPAVFLHGGPGGGTNPDYRRFWDPSAYRIVLFDQRGCGRSRPHASLERNTTAHLVSDIEVLRRELAVERWQVFGGSWGSTLALAYAQAHPDRVSELVLRGIFMLRPEEIHWYYQEGASRIYPDEWEHFLTPIPEDERHDLVTAYYRRLTGDDETERIRCAKAWSVWEGSTSNLVPDADHIAQSAETHFAEAFARIECHYFIHGGFFDAPDQLLRNANRILDIPCHIVHGRYDVVCPLKNAWDLHQALPQSTLQIVQNAGHSAMEAGISAALVATTDRFRNASEDSHPARSKA